MSRLWFLLAFILLLGGTLGSGWLHGRWEHDDTLEHAADRLKQGLPARLGPWRLVKTHQLDKEVSDVLRCAACWYGAYTHDQTGHTVIVALLAGPSGPISVHTPEICYSSHDFELAGERQRFELTDQAAGSHALWQLHANARQSGRPNQRVLYGWSDGGPWQATQHPRFAYAGLPVLYKLQLAGPQMDDQPDDKSDPCRDFLSRFLAHLQPRLVRSARLASLAP